MCFNNNTLGDEMDTAGLSWAYYASTINGDGGIWSAYQNIEPIYNGPDWNKDVISPQTNFFSDVSNGKLRDAELDHADLRKLRSRRLRQQDRPVVGRLARQRDREVEVLGLDRDLHLLGRLRRLVRSRAAGKSWITTASGMRIPMLIVSAYAKKGYVSHTHYEHGSILKFVEETFGLAGASGQR